MQILSAGVRWIKEKRSYVHANIYEWDLKCVCYINIYVKMCRTELGNHKKKCYMGKHTLQSELYQKVRGNKSLNC